MGQISESGADVVCGAGLYTWSVGDEVVQYSDSGLTDCLNACPVSSFHVL